MPCHPYIREAEKRVVVPKPANFKPTPYAYPWAFLVTGLGYEDALVLTHYHIWFSKCTQFVALDTATHYSNFIGCFKDLLMGPKDEHKIREAFISGFQDA
jgi:hypothetical protein